MQEVARRKIVIVVATVHKHDPTTGGHLCGASVPGKYRQISTRTNTKGDVDSQKHRNASKEMVDGYIETK